MGKLLAGAHTIGETPCQFIRYRLYNFTSTGNSDPTINQAFLGSWHSSMLIARKMATAPPGGIGQGQPIQI